MAEPEEPSEIVARLLERQTPDLMDPRDERSMIHLLKAVRAAGTQQGTEVGARSHLVNKEASRKFRDLNTTHATCLDAKRSSSVGMGHREQAIYEALDPLCRFGWQDVLDACGDDDMGEGEGFIEVVWDPDRTRVLGLNHLDGAAVNVVVEQMNDSERIHYQVTSATAVRETVAMAAWGDMLNLKARYGDRGGLVRNDLVGTRDGVLSAPLGGLIVDSEVIHLRQPTPRDPYMGYPDWVAATPAMELVHALIRHEFDFHFNRGVPEIIYHLIGGTLNPKDWAKIESIFKANQGVGNSQKSAAIHYPGSPESYKVQIDKLGDPRSQDFFGEKSDALAMLIATAHGVPPLLANILLPGKIGSANEGPNALLLFQKRKLGQIQRRYSRTLAATLGSGVLLAQPDGTTKTLTKDLFLGSRFAKGEKDPMTGQPAPPKDETGSPIYVEPGNGFKTVLDGMTLGAQDTMARMKEPMAGSGRNPADGLLGGADDRKPGDPRKSR